MICEFCGKEHDGNYGSGRFCSKSCQAKYIVSKVKNHKCNFPSKKGKGNWSCIICNKIFSTRRELCEHNKQYHMKKDGENWNKGLTKNTDKRIAKGVETYKNNKHIPWNKGRTGVYSKETLRKMSDTMKRVSKTRVSCKGVGKAHKGWYKGIWCDSSWELAFLIYNLDHGIKIKRCDESFEYEYKNEIHLYHPDFITNDNEYNEIKGYETDKDKNKFECFPKDKTLIIYKREDLKEIFEYILKTYNIDKINDIYKLYDKLL